MMEFAAGVMLGGSIGAVIMGALLSHARAGGTWPGAYDAQRVTDTPAEREHPVGSLRRTSRHPAATRLPLHPSLN